MSVTGLALVGLVAAVTPAAATPAIRFAPVARKPFVLETRETRMSAGKPVHFTMRHHLRFVPLGAGWRLDATLTEFATDAQGVPKAAYEAAMRPFVGVDTATAVSADGTPIGALDIEATWAKVAEGQHAAAEAMAASGLPPSIAAGLRAHFEAVAASPREARDTMLTAFAWDLLALSAPALRPGERMPYEGHSDVPGAGSVTERGTTAYVADAGGDALFALDAETDPAELARAADALAADMTGGDGDARARLAAAVARIRSTRVRRLDTYVVDRATGLMRSSKTVREIVSGNAPPNVVERTLTVTFP